MESIKILNLGTYIENALIRSEINNIEDLILLTYEDHGPIKGIGENSLEKIKESLVKYNDDKDGMIIEFYLRKIIEKGYKTSQISEILKNIED